MRARRMLGGGPIRAGGDAFFRINERRLNALLQATQNDMQRAEQAVLRRADDQYRKIIFNSQVYANTGAGTVQKAVDMATKDFLMRGIDCIEYKNGARHTISDYADMAIKTANKRGVGRLLLKENHMLIEPKRSFGGLVLNMGMDLWPAQRRKPL